MDDEDLSERRLKLASIMDRVRSLKTKYQTDDNLSEEVNFSGCPAEVTDHSGSVSHLMMTGNNPEDWWNLLLKMEKTGDPHTDSKLQNKLTDFYSRAVTVLTAEEYSQNESYAKILVRFAEVKALLNPEEARDQFQISRLNCKTFAFVHIAFAQFEWSQGNFKKSKQILHKAIQCRAVPVEMLEIAMQNLYLKKRTLLSEDQENIPVKTASNLQESNHQHLIGQSRNRKTSDSSGDHSINVNSYLRIVSSPEEADAEIGQQPLLQLPNKIVQFGRVPLETIISPGGPKTCNTDVPNAMRRQTSGSMHLSAVVPSFTIPKPDGDDDSYNLGNVKFAKDIGNVDSQFSIQDNLEAATDSTLTLLNKTDSSMTVKRKETEVMAQDSNNPELMEQEPNSELYHQSSTRLHEQANHRLPSHSSENPEQAKLNHVENAWKVPESSCHRNTTEGKQNSSQASVSKRVTPPGTAPNRKGPGFVCETPGNTQNDYMSCFRTPVVNEGLPPMSRYSTPYSNASGYQQSKPQTPASQFQNHGGFQVTTPQSENDYIEIKGKVYSILRQIGTGGSSKVFQVMDERKRLFAVKYVNLEEADQLTMESYRNEIDHLIKLQSHSDKIIKLYDYEITDDHIHMVMECGNIDLNSWLRKKKTISPWERKSYWKNMLEAVHTIHQHGIVHSDLKPANFLIVDGMLKLIDFGIANQMQPDVTSIVKDSQVGTVNYMAPECIKDLYSNDQSGRGRSKISPKSDVWSLGCILYCMTYGRTPFQHITNQITKLHAIIDASCEIEYPPMQELDLLDVLQKCLVRNPKWRISIAELLVHPYVQIQPLPDQQMSRGTSEEVKRILGQLIGLNSPNSISRAARSLYEQCDSGRSLNVAAFAKPVAQKTWTMK